LSDELENIVKELGGEMIHVGTSVKTVSQTAAALGVKPKQIIKSLLVITEGKGPILAILDGESKLDLRKLSERFGYSRLATPKEVKRITGYDVGGVPPIGIDVRTIMDDRVLENSEVYGGGGSTDRLVKLSPKKIAEYQKAEITRIRE